METMTRVDKFKEVYADAQGDDRTFEETEKIRSLTWKGERASLADVAKLYATIRLGYNNFSYGMIPHLLAEFPEGIDATPAREYSVAIYLHPTPDLADKLELFVRKHFDADEIDWDESTLRVWWD